MDYFRWKCFMCANEDAQLHLECQLIKDRNLTKTAFSFDIPERWSTVFCRHATCFHKTKPWCFAQIATDPSFPSQFLAKQRTHHARSAFSHVAGNAWALRTCKQQYFGSYNKGNRSIFCLWPPVSIYGPLTSVILWTTTNHLPSVCHTCIQDALDAILWFASKFDGKFSFTASSN